MTIEELKAAYAAGAKIQVGGVETDIWKDLEYPQFDGLASSYRIKPTDEEETP